MCKRYPDSAGVWRLARKETDLSMKRHDCLRSILRFVVRVAKQAAYSDSRYARHWQSNDPDPNLILR